MRVPRGVVFFFFYYTSREYYYLDRYECKVTKGIRAMI